MREMHRQKIAHLFYIRVLMCPHCLPVICATVEIEKPFRLWDMLDGPLEDFELSFEITHTSKHLPRPSLLSESRVGISGFFSSATWHPIFSSGEVIMR